jgi:predicted phosphoribosyltransferase
MASKNNGGASKGLFAGIEETGRGVKELAIQKSEKIKVVKSESRKEVLSKRSYMLKGSTIKKLQELKVFVYDDPDVTYNEIVDKAIILLYDTEKNK